MVFEFKDYMPLTWLLLYLFHEKYAKSLGDFLWFLENIDDAFHHVVSNEEANKALDLALDDIRRDKIKKMGIGKIPHNPHPAKIEEIYVDSYSFFEWAKSKSYILSDDIKSSLKDFNETIRPSNFKNFPLELKIFEEKRSKPLWDLVTAILYIKGYAGCNNLNFDRCCVLENNELLEIYEDAFNAHKIGSLNLEKGAAKVFDVPSKWEELYSVKPEVFIEWAKARKISSPFIEAYSSKTQSLISAKNDCYHWLVELMKDNQPPPLENKAQHLKLAQQKFPHLSPNGYTDARNEARRHTKNTLWGKGGRKSKGTIDN